MKAFTQLTLLAATVALCAAATQALAADIVASPKALDLQKSFAKMGGATADQMDRTVHTVPPATLKHQRSLARSGSAANDQINRTAQTVPAHLRKAFELAPLK